MAKCEHEWLGTDKGVDCMKCGIHLSSEEYREWLKGPPESLSSEEPKEAVKAKRKKAVRTNAG